MTSSARGPDARRVALGASAMLLIACEAGTEPLDWSIEIPDGPLSESTVALDVALLAGTCEGPVIHPWSLERDEPDLTPVRVAPGDYAIRVRTRDANCVWTAATCEEMTLPMDVPLRQRVEPLATPTPRCAPESCRAGRCTSLPAPGERWVPRPGASWQYQLNDEIDTSFDVDVYVIDLADASASALARLAEDRRAVVCWFSAGTLDVDVTDVAGLDPEAIGDPVPEGGEMYLDISDPTVRALIATRLDIAVARGCNGVAPDNVDTYADSDFGLDADDQLDFNRYIAAEAHARGLSVALCNDVAQAGTLEPDFDFALDSDCVAESACASLAPFAAAGKAVLHVETGDAALAEAICPDSFAMGFSTIVKHDALDAWRVACE